MTRETGIGPGGAAHVAVLVGEVVEWLRPRPGACLVDATVGLGGHAAALLAAAPGARLLGLDRDRAALARAAERLPGERVVLRQARFSELAAVLAELGWDGADAVLLDLGVSSLQLDDPARGFSLDRKSTRLNSSHGSISYAVFCLKKKKKKSRIRKNTNKRTT